MTTPITALIAIGILLAVATIGWAVTAIIRRKNQPVIVDPDADLDQTCELNYKPE